MSGPPVEVRLLGPRDGHLLENVAPDVFDGPVRAELTSDFLADERHHLAVAVEAGVVVGMASAVHYVHPDKPPELWINEVGVAPTHRRRGLARELLAALLDHARALGCTGAWLLTESDNGPARALYSAAGGEVDEATVLYAWRFDAD